MTQEKFKETSKIQEEINRLNLLIKCIEDKVEKDFTDTMELVFNMSRKDDLLGYMKTRKRMLEKEFEEL